MTHRARLCIALALCAGCGDDATTPPSNTANDYRLSGTSPFPVTFAVGDRIRSVVLRAESRVGGDVDVSRCGYDLAVFDITQAPTVTPILTDTSGDCKLYRTPPEEQYTPQRAVCLGALNVESGAIMETRVFCPAVGGPMRGSTDNFMSCGNFFAQRTAMVTSVDDGVKGDVVTDLMSTVNFPTSVRFTSPSDLAVFTWPASGDLLVRWTSAQATSAVVRLEPDGSTMGPVILCTPRTNGTMRIETALINMAGFRTMNTRLRVWSYREATVQAMGVPWRVAGAMGSSLLLQPAR
jgi:hypothetical protein